MRVGAAVRGGRLLVGRSGTIAICWPSEFNSVTARASDEVALAPSRTRPLGAGTTSRRAGRVRRATHDMEVRGHAVVWPHAGTCPTTSRSAPTTAAELRRHFRRPRRGDPVRALPKGRVARRIDLVNEPLHWLEGRDGRAGVGRDCSVPDYLAEVMTTAHELAQEIDPDRRTVDQRNPRPTWSPDKHGHVRPASSPIWWNEASPLARDRHPGPPALPRLHPRVPPPPTQLAQTVATYGDMGLEVAVTEMDVLAHASERLIGSRFKPGSTGSSSTPR